MINTIYKTLKSVGDRNVYFYFWDMNNKINKELLKFLVLEPLDIKKDALKVLSFRVKTLVKFYFFKLKLRFLVKVFRFNSIEVLGKPFSMEENMYLRKYQRR